MTYYASSGTLKPTHSLTLRSQIQHGCTQAVKKNSQSFVHNVHNHGSE